MEYLTVETSIKPTKAPDKFCVFRIAGDDYIFCPIMSQTAAASASIRWKPAHTEIFEKKQEAVAIYLAAASLFVRPSCFSDLVMWVLDSCSREWA